MRRALLLVLLAGMAGTVVELLLLKHTEGFWQLAPLGLMGLALLWIGGHVVAPGPVSIRGLQVLMTMFVVSGVAGVLLHYRGNVEWELERMPGIGGVELFKGAIMGATPALAPGTMLLLGVVGLLYTFRHPALQRPQSHSSFPDGGS